jgi:hypothetical protein
MASLVRLTIASSPVQHVGMGYESGLGKEIDVVCNAIGDVFAESIAKLGGEIVLAFVA